MSKNFLSVAVLAAGLVVSAQQVALASDHMPYTEQAFAASQHEGKPILVDIAADWCPTCARQEPIIEKLTADPAFRDFVVYRVDFDAQTKVVRAFGARSQSTLIVFRGGVEKGRSTGDTNPDSIKKLLQMAN